MVCWLLDAVYVYWFVVSDGWSLGFLCLGVVG